LIIIRPMTKTCCKL